MFRGNEVARRLWYYEFFYISLHQFLSAKFYSRAKLVFTVPTLLVVLPPIMYEEPYKHTIVDGPIFKSDKYSINKVCSFLMLDRSHVLFGIHHHRHFTTSTQIQEGTNLVYNLRWYLELPECDWGFSPRYAQSASIYLLPSTFDSPLLHETTSLASSEVLFVRSSSLQRCYIHGYDRVNVCRLDRAEGEVGGMERDGGFYGGITRNKTLPETSMTNVETIDSRGFSVGGCGLFHADLSMVSL
jgi:hypothetical protein